MTILIAGTADLASAAFNLTGVSGAGGYTYLQQHPPILQSGYLASLKIQIKAASSATGCKFKIFRDGKAIYTSEATDLAAGENSIDVKNFPRLQAGDQVGFFTPNSNGQVFGSLSEPGAAFFYDASGGEVDDSATITTAIANTQFAFAMQAANPDLCVVGDSIAAGHNTPNNFLSYLDGTNAGGFADAWPGTVIGRLTGWSVENHARGSQTFAWVRSTGIPAAVARNPERIWVHCGVNDVAAARSWSDVEADLDAIRSMVASPALIFTEILPWTAGSDSQAATIRAWNASLAAWCSANNAALVRCHDVFAKTRVTTGELDDLADEYNDDNVHLSVSGVVLLGTLVSEIKTTANGSPLVRRLSKEIQERQA